MSSSRSSSRLSPLRTKQTGKTSALLPAQIPLPPSPPASDALLIEDHFGPPSPRTVRRRASPRRKASGSREPVRESARRRDTHRALEAAIESKQQLSRTRVKKRRVLEDPFDSNSPPTSPTTSKSASTTKRPRASKSCPALRPLVSSTSCPIEDSPNNPFLVRPGEKPRRPGAKRDDEYRKLVYVFRGKRISRPRRPVQTKTLPNSTHPHPLSGPVKASQTMAKAMR
ncbi:hypothetical protein PtB15_2B343 [Puccinia triticina]|nr:hypothetical protein PtB15_2B343 [Puccinia triticina]